MSGLSDTESDIRRAAPGAAVTKGLAIHGSHVAEAESALRIQHAAERIALLEGIRASDEEVAEELAGICQQNGMTIEQLRPYMNAEFEQTVAANIRMKKAIAFVRSHAVVTKKDVTGTTK